MPSASGARHGLAAMDDDPAHGMDLGSRYRLVRHQAKKGKQQGAS